MSIASKIRKFHELLSDGKYGAIFWRILSMLPKKAVMNIIYSFLSIRYRSFISAQKSVELPLRGGGHEDVIWCLWLQGEDNAPEVCKACLRSLRYWHSDKKIITLNYSNISDYITLPDYITRKYEQGLISNTHFSDIVRAELLTRHGGIWIDATVYCTGRKFEDVMRLPFFAFQTKSFSIIASSWFIVSDAHNPIITLTRDLLFEYWKNYSYDLVRYFLFHMFFKMATETYSDEWSKVPYFANSFPHEMQHSMYDDYSDEKMKYLAGISDFHKLTYVNPEKLTPLSILQHVIDSYK